MTTKTIRHGEVAGSATAAQMPDKPYQNGYIKAAADNAGTVYIGASSSVTAKNGSTDTTTGFPLAAGEVIVLGAPGNLNEMYYICDNAGDDFIYYLEDF